MNYLYFILFSTTLFLTNNTFAQVQVDSIDIKTFFYGPFNKTIAEIFLYNPNDVDSIEGRIVFEVNKTAFVENLWLEIGTDLKKAHTLKRSQGERIYDQITRKRIDPALLIKSGNGQYVLSVFPFMKHQKRKVILVYYSILESDTSQLPFWFFDLKTTLKDIKSKIHLTSFQEENVKLFKSNGNSLEEIISKRKVNKISSIDNFTFINENKYQLFFDFTGVKAIPIYFLDSISFYPASDKLLKTLNFYKEQKYPLQTSAIDQYPPDFIRLLIKKINNGEKPYVQAFGKDYFLNNFLQYLKTTNKLYLQLNEIPDRIDESKIIIDDYNWILKDNNWYYVDKFLTLSQKSQSIKNKLPVKIECPYLNKFIEYLTSLNYDIEHQSEKGFLNSKLAKLIIEEDKRALEIWEEVTKTEYKSTPTYFVAVEEMPEPIGGIDTIKNCLFFPEILKGQVSNSKIYILTKITKSGHAVELNSIKRSEVISYHSANTISNNALLEKISCLAVCFPQWKPGKQRGNNVVVQVSVPITFQVNSLPSIMEYKSGTRSFYSNVPDTTKCYLLEKDFKVEKAKIIKFNSAEFFNILFKNPDLLDIVYKTLYLSNFDGLAFNILFGNRLKYYFVEK